MPVRQQQPSQSKASTNRHPTQPFPATSEETPETLGQAISNPVQTNLTPGVVLSLQRLYGNQFVQRLISHTPSSISRKAKVSSVSSSNPVIQRDYKDNADDFIVWITNHEKYKEFAYGEAGMCAPSAKAIGELLKGEGIAFQFRGILLFHKPEARRSNLNRNHFVVVATIAGQEIVIDPTQGQFQDGGAMVAKENEWANKFKTLKAKVLVSQEGNDFIWKNTPMKYKDGATWEAANNYAKDSGITFDNAEGTVLNNPV